MSRTLIMLDEKHLQIWQHKAPSEAEPYHAYMIQLLWWRFWGLSYSVSAVLPEWKK